MRLKENTKEKLMLTKIVLIVFLAFVVYALLKKVFFGDARKAGRRTGYARGGSSSSSSYDYSSSSVWSDGGSYSDSGGDSGGSCGGGD